MSIRHPRSLKWRLVTWVAAAQGAMFALLILAMTGVVGALWMRGSISSGIYERSTIEALTEAVGRGARGELILRPAPELERLRREIQGFWFIVRDSQGREVTEGQAPAELTPLMKGLDTVESAVLRGNRGDDAPSLAIVQWIDTAAGRVQMLTGGQGRLLLHQVVAAAVAAPGSAEAVFGAIDAMKLRSSLTLFAAVADDPAPFRQGLERFFDGQDDPATLTRLDHHRR